MVHGSNNYQWLRSLLTYLIHSSIYRLSCKYPSSSAKHARHLSNNTYKFPSRLSPKKLCSTHKMYSYHGSKRSLPSYERSNVSYFLQYKTDQVSRNPSMYRHGECIYARSYSLCLRSSWCATSSSWARRAVRNWHIIRPFLRGLTFSFNRYSSSPVSAFVLASIPNTLKNVLA